jgi:ATP-dependent helicase YprA (DUF1998 family)
MLELNLERVRANARKATTEDLLDRVTVYRGGMEPAALEVIEAELIERGITVEQVRDHQEARRRALTRADGTVVKCSHCYRPAVARTWGWHKLFGRIPLFPRRLACCEEHAPKPE